MTRFHQGDHRIWLRDEPTVTSARQYLDLRYKLAPSLISAGRLIQSQGFPLTARCDLLWPEHPEARDPTQYIHLNATLVAPLEGDGPQVQNSRSVWIPPGDWQNAWSGKVELGPKTIQITAPANQIPMWHKKGAVLVTAQGGAMRIAEQDWSSLVLEGFPSRQPSVEHRVIFGQEGSPDADSSSSVTLETDSQGWVQVSVSSTVRPQAWTVRLHLHRGQRLELTHGFDEVSGPVRHLQPDCSDTGPSHFFPFGGPGMAPACHAGPVAEFDLEPAAGHRRWVRAALVAA